MVESPKYTEGKVYINKSQYFSGVPESVWNYIEEMHFYKKWFYFLSTKNKFNLIELNKNLINTFNNRNTTISNRSKIFTDSFKSNIDMEKKWQSFLRRNRLKLNYNFSQIMEKLENFIDFPCNNIISDYNWNPELNKWEIY